MNWFSKHRINNEADAIVNAWTRDYSIHRLRKIDIDEIARMFADRFVGQFSLKNADKVTLAVWRRYCHVLPAKHDIATANIKRLINAVRRHVAQEKKARTNINKAVKGTPVPFSRDI